MTIPENRKVNMIMVVNALVSVTMIVAVNEFSTSEEADCSTEENEHDSENGSTERFNES
jgi:nitrogen fixation protein FixH